MRNCNKLDDKSPIYPKINEEPLLIEKQNTIENEMVQKL